MSTVAVTGCSGYLGRKVCSLLEADDSVSRVIGVDVREPGFSTRNLEFYRMDVRSPDLAAALDGCDAIVHLAAVGGHEARDVIVDGMRSVVGAAAEVRTGKLVFTSSALVYGSHGDNLTEESPVRPGPHAYAAANAEAEEAARAFAFEQRDAVVTILRLATVSGPSVPASPIVPVHAATQVLHEDDAARAVHHALKELLPGTFNACADAPDHARGVVMSNERLLATGFVPGHTSAQALAAGAEAQRGWVTFGGVRFKPRWAVAALGSVAALAIGSAARARRAKT
jgi:UDP-glucose 4-epimerase